MPTPKGRKAASSRRKPVQPATMADSGSVPAPTPASSVGRPNAVAGPARDDPQRAEVRPAEPAQLAEGGPRLLLAQALGRGAARLRALAIEGRTWVAVPVERELKTVLAQWGALGLRPDVLRVIPPASPVEAAAELERIGLAILKTDPPVAGHAHEPRRRLLAEAAIGLRVRLRRHKVARRRDRHAYGADEAAEMLNDDLATFLANGLPAAPRPDAGLAPYSALIAWTGATRKAIEAELDKLPAPTTAEIIKSYKAALAEVGPDEAMRRTFGETFYEPPATYYGAPSDDEKEANPKAVDDYPTTDDSYLNWTDSPAKLWAFVKAIRRDVTARWDPAKAKELLRVWRTARARAEALGLAVPDDTDDARTAFDRLDRLALDIEKGPPAPAPAAPAVAVLPAVEQPKPRRKPGPKINVALANLCKQITDDPTIAEEHRLKALSEACRRAEPPILDPGWTDLKRVVKYAKHAR